MTMLQRGYCKKMAEKVRREECGVVEAAHKIGKRRLMNSVCGFAADPVCYLAVCRLKSPLSPSMQALGEGPRQSRRMDWWEVTEVAKGAEGTQVTKRGNGIHP